MEYTPYGWLSTLLLAGLIPVFLIVYQKRKLRILRGYGLPGPPPLPFLGNMKEMLQTGIYEMEKKWLKEYGDVFVWHFGCQQNITTIDQTILKEVLVRDFSNFSNRKLLDTTPNPLDKGIFFLRDADWKRVRSIMNPAFSSSKLRMMNDDINKCARTLTEHLARSAETAESITIKDFYGAFTMSVISMTAFGLEVDSQQDNPLIGHLRKIFSNAKPPIAVFLCALFGNWMIPILKYLQICFYPRDSLAFFNREVRMMVEDRKKNPNNRTDFLQLLINARSEGTADNEAEKYENKTLTTNEIIGQAFLFFLAGYETTASLLSFSAYEMAVNQDVQDKVYQEIVEQLGHDEPTYDNVGKLKYMECVFLETLRLYPTLARLTREASNTVVINGVTIPKGSGVTIPVMCIHHDPNIYPDPYSFRPERFEDFKPNQNQVNFIPFGHGPRICIGMRLALMEAKIAVTHVLRKVKFVQSIETEVPLTLKDVGLTQTKNPIKIKVEPRKFGSL